jgi:hypothetical protein
MQKHIYDGLIAAMPFPMRWEMHARSIVDAVNAYLSAVEASEFASASMERDRKHEVKQALLLIDAEVLKLYDLPSHLERQLLDLFTGVERKGVGCDFHGYPSGSPSGPAALPVTIPTDDRPVWERIAALAAALPEETIAGLPADGASQLDHYLYGAPKRKP